MKVDDVKCAPFMPFEDDLNPWPQQLAHACQGLRDLGMKVSPRMKSISSKNGGYLLQMHILMRMNLSSRNKR